MAGRIQPLDYLTPSHTKEIKDAVDRHSKISTRIGIAAIVLAALGVAVAVWAISQ